MRAILTYHSIDASGSAISVDAATFRRHVRWLATSGVEITTIEHLVTSPPETEAVALTFDDGFTSFASHGWPLLRDHGFRVTLCVVADRVGRTNGWSTLGRTIPSLPLLDWASLARLAEEGVTLGSHSRTHCDLRACSEDGLADEVAGAAARIAAETGRRPALFAYPFGAWDQSVRSAVGATHRHACTTALRPLGDVEDPLCLPRLDAYYLRTPGRLESWGSAGLRRYLWLRARGRSLRRRLGKTGVGA